MTIRELYIESVKRKEMSLLLLLDFLVKEKKTVKWEDDTSVLQLYYKPNNRKRMNELLKEYKGKGWQK